MKHGIVQGLIREFYINFFIQEKNELYLCSNWIKSDREERTFFELLLFYKVTLKMFFLSLCYLCYHQNLPVSLPLVSRYSCIFLGQPLIFFVTWMPCLHKLCTHNLSSKVGSATQKWVLQEKQPLHKPGVKALCWRLCWPFSKDHLSGHCARICRESSTPHFHTLLLKPQRRPSTCAGAEGHLSRNKGLFPRVLLHLLLVRYCSSSAELDTNNSQYHFPLPCCWAAENVVLSSLLPWLPAVCVFLLQCEL